MSHTLRACNRLRDCIKHKYIVTTALRTTSITHRHCSTQYNSVQICQYHSTVYKSMQIAVISPTTLYNTEPLQVTKQVVDSYASQSTRSVSLRQMMQFGYKPSTQQILISAQFLYTEMLVRMCKRIVELSDLPFGLSNAAEVLQIIQLYRLSVADLFEIPIPSDESSELLFTQTVQKILLRHQDIVVQLARGMKNSFVSTNLEQSNFSLNSNEKSHFLLQEFLDRFNMSRIGLRLVMSQHIALHHQRSGIVGIIHNQCSPLNTIQQAIYDCNIICNDTFGIVPNINVTEKPDIGISFRFIPVFLRYIVYEVLKNSMRATIERHYDPNATEQTLPDIDIFIVDSDDNIVIKISDRGGGIRRVDLPMIFTYSFTTETPPHIRTLIEQQQGKNIAGTAKPLKSAYALPSSQQQMSLNTTLTGIDQAEQLPILYQSSWLIQSNKQNTPDSIDKTPAVHHHTSMYGDAFGLPLARLYARALGGELEIYSLNGYGTDCFITCPKITAASDTPLPE